MPKSTLFLFPLFALAFLLVSCTSTPSSTSDPPGTDPSAMMEESPDSTSSMKGPSATKAPKFDGKLLTGTHTVVLHTSKGDITLQLDAKSAPKTVTNFITLAKAGYFDGLTFHRVIPNFMIQGGDPAGSGAGGDSIFGSTFEDEINAKSYGLDKTLVKDVAGDQPVPPEIAALTVKQYLEQYENYTFNEKLQSLPMVRGAIAMANRGANTNGSQFFIIQTEATPWLEGKHTVFGKVMKGLDIVDALVAVDADPQTGKPKTPVTFTVEVK